MRGRQAFFAGGCSSTCVDGCSSGPSTIVVDLNHFSLPFAFARHKVCVHKGAGMENRGKTSGLLLLVSGLSSGFLRNIWAAQARVSVQLEFSAQTLAA
jgi:hypothetical protein